MSEATKESLKGAYETEPGNGRERDSYLKDTTTYLIVEKVCIVLCYSFIVNSLFCNSKKHKITRKELLHALLLLTTKQVVKSPLTWFQSSTCWIHGELKLLLLKFQNQLLEVLF